jgi:hypothetical protein
MAEPSTTPVSSASTDDAASEPCRYAHGSEVIAKLRARVSKLKLNAETEAKRFADMNMMDIQADYASQWWAFHRIERILDDMESGSDQKQHEGTKPSS